MTTVIPLLKLAEYADVSRELDLMSAALQRNDSEAARHHEFVALIMANELTRERKIHESIKSDDDKIVLSAQACVVQPGTT
jgi:hypothetical protein